MPVTSTLYVPLGADDPALMVSVSMAVLPLVSVADGVIVQVIGDAGVQVKDAAPAKPFTEERLMVSVPEAPTATGTIVVSGTIEKSESGLEMELRFVEDGAYVVLPRYWTVIRLVPWESTWLFSTAVKVELSPEPGLRAASTVGMLYPEEKNSTDPVGAALPLWPVTVPVTVMLVLGEILPAMLAVVVEARPLDAATLIPVEPEAAT